MNRITTITIDWMKIAESLGWLVTALALVPYSAGDIALVFPPWAKPYILGVFGTATVLVKVWRALPSMPGNRPVGGAIGPEDVKPGALVDPPPPAPCPVCEHKKHVKKRKRRRKPRRT